MLSIGGKGVVDIHDEVTVYQKTAILGHPVGLKWTDLPCFWAIGATSAVYRRKTTSPRTDWEISKWSKMWNATA